MECFYIWRGLTMSLYLRENNANSLLDFYVSVTSSLLKHCLVHYINQVFTPQTQRHGLIDRQVIRLLEKGKISQIYCPLIMTILIL